jgi:alginate O-acetyltransferase complex protein AlgI
MNFAETRFWQLLLPLLAAVIATRCVLQRTAHLPKLFDKAALLALSLFLLGATSWLTFWIFLIVSLTTYAGLLWVQRMPPEYRRKSLFVLIPLQLLPLLYYKYGNFISQEVFGSQSTLLQTVFIPVGISFYTFQKIAFALDTLHFNKPLPRFLDYLNFAGFFPQIVAGPIERRESLLPQMENFRFQWVPASIDTGAPWIVLGFFLKCCLADNLALNFDPSSATNPFLIWLSNVIFGLRIYYDFAGYSCIALGLALCLGVRLTLNFASPYTASNATDFWRRWHITLSQWFRDYLYIPLGGGRVRWWAFNVLVVFAISGIWHGAGWNYLFWGMLHGLFLIVHRILGSRLPIPRSVGWGLTMIAVFLAWLCFYENRTDVLTAKLHTLFNPAAYNGFALREAIHYWNGPHLLVMAFTLSLCAAVQMLEWRSSARGEPFALLRKPGIAALLIVLTMILSPSRQNDFIYFAF